MRSESGFGLVESLLWFVHPLVISLLCVLNRHVEVGKERSAVNQSRFSCNTAVSKTKKTTSSWGAGQKKKTFRGDRS